MSEDANNLSVLIHKRSCIDAELDTVVQLGIEATSNSDSYRKFMVSCMELPRIQDQFESIQTAIEGLEMKEKQAISKDHVEIRSAFNDLIREIKSIQFDFELQKEEAIERARKEDAKAVHESTLQNQVDKATAPVQLPKLSVPLFSGDFRQWKPFSEIFVSLIDNDKRLSDVAKFQYLLSYVRGDASKLLRGLPVTGNNYKKAWGILEYSFNNERLIAMQHMDSLYKLPTLNVASASGLRTILTGFLENMGALESMGFPIDDWDFMLYHMLYRKIDPITRRDFDKSITTNRIPKFHELREFLDREIISWESSRSFSRANQNFNSSHGGSSSAPSTPRIHALVSGSASEGAKSNKCILCKRLPHSLVACHQFKKKNPYDRFVFAKDNRLCLRCLKPMHDSSDAQCALIRCSICSAPHHCALLHFAKNKNDEGVKEESGQDSHGSSEGTSSNVVSLCVGKEEPERKFMVHYTAVVLIRDSLGNYHRARALVDPGSDTSFITESLFSRLGLPRRKCSTPIHGIGDVKTRSRGAVSTIIKSHVGSGPEFHFEGLVMGHITSDKPRLPLETESWSFLSHLVLADPTFHTPSPVEILIGGEIYEEILLGEKIRGPPGTPAAISTSLGWLIIGKVDNKFVRNGDKTSSYSSLHISNLSIEERLDQSIRRFWEIESVPEKPILSPEDQRCEEIFVKTHKRLDSGRYVVSLPFRDAEPSLGESRHLALARLRSVERRFARDDKFRQMYTDFMDDYLESGHMELVTEEIKGKHCYIAHSGVLRPSSTTTQCRTVFDAAAATSDGTSLNDTQLVGPKLQKDVGDLICNFRLHAVAFTADIRKMYRQILVDEKHQNYQLILWRKTLGQEPQTFRLKTVTYGLSSSPFLAIRVMQQLAHDHQSEFPEAAEVLRRFTYMDDVVSGSDSIDSAVNLQRQLIGLLQKGCFDLRKWCSNSPEFLDRLPDSTKNIESATVSLDEDGSVKILGLAWHPHKDVFTYSVRPLNDKVTKRVILSETARIFDPLGFLCPVIISAKILFQELWLAGVDWDSEVPDAIRHKWLCLAKEFPDLSKIQISRFVPTRGCRVQLHGFCDSSEVAFAAVVYFRVVHPDNTVSVHILTGKSRVAPKGEKKRTLPRLELCGATVLAKLFDYVRRSLASQVKIEKEFAWTDSSIVLCWLRASPHNWATYVANRVSEIQEVISPEKWKHVRSSDNPADCASRGLTPSQIVDHEQWWSGPSWLRLPEEQWPVSNVDLKSVEVPELRVQKVTALAVDPQGEPPFVTRYSSFHKLTKIMAYCMRFIKVCRTKSKIPGPLTVRELQDCSIRLVKVVQKCWFAADIQNLKAKRPCSTRLQRLNPFLDELGLIRVGGRLKYSKLNFNAKHPLLLPANSHLTVLIVDHYHLSNLHSGLQATLAYIARYYWILSARRVVKQRLFKCMRCYRHRPTVLEPIMADLPEVRIQQVRPFVKVAVDYAGPVMTKVGTLRKSRVEKSYICIFVCLTTRALHIELASNLSTDAFLAALLRFTHRRGSCSDIYSDNGKNFVGASRELKDLFKFIEQENSQISREMLKERVTWHFNPPAAPHFTGIAEAAVKSVKSHLVRIIGNTTLTFEEMATVLIRIEGALNSRPLCPLSSDPNDFEVLTPGHFIIGEPINSVPERDVTDINVNRLTRWQLLQRFVQGFWKRWHREYLHTLQQRGKWTKSTNNLSVGTLVLINDPNIPPLQWKIGRVLEVHPSRDGVVRSVTLKTQQSQMKRPVHKLSPLPIE